MPAVVTGPNATQNSPFFSQQWPKPSPVVNAFIHGGMARLIGPEWPGKYRGGIPASGDLQFQY